MSEPLYKKDNLRPSLIKRVQRNIQAIKRVGMVATLPIPIVAGTLLLWNYLCYKQDFHLMKEANEIIITSWSALFILFLAISGGRIFDTVLARYEKMNTAVEKKDEGTFLDLLPRQQHPIVFVMLSLCAAAVISTFICINYPDQTSGIVIIGSSTYFCSLFIIIVHELDSPTNGFLFIENISPEWVNNPRRNVLTTPEFISRRK